MIVVSAVALSEKVPDPEMRPHGFELRVGELIDLDECAQDLVAAGYEHVDQVEDRGQFAIRGGLLDLFPSTEDRAVRVDLFGDEIETLRWFSTFTQRSLGDAEVIEVAPAAELAPEHRELAEIAALEDAADRPDVAELLPVDRFHPWLEMAGADADVLIAAEEDIAPALTDHWQDLTAAYPTRTHVRSTSGPTRSSRRWSARVAIRLSSIDQDQPFAFRAQAADIAARGLKEAEPELEKLARSGYRPVVTFARRGEGERFAYNLGRLKVRWLDDGSSAIDGAGLLTFAARPALGAASSRPSSTSRSSPITGCFIVAGPPSPTAPGAASSAGASCAASRTCAPATSSSTRTTGSRASPALTPRPWPASPGTTSTSSTPALTACSCPSTSWPRSAATSAPAVPTRRCQSSAAHAGRRSSPAPAVPPRSSPASCSTSTPSASAAAGHAFPIDTDWQREFEDAFPFNETPDQRDAIEFVKADMEAPRPMDRLICGDVGYGKTEVALRAAFKAVQDGKQVMLLVPTTILAQQHYGTFSERLKDYPVTIEHVSRFRSAAEQKEAIARFSRGEVDILVGTHRLLSRDVRAKDLGLLIVDEEQRFGVKQKELLRQLKLRVDVIAMSATPIPRTLQMSLAGVRDISVIETPPEGRRPVKTWVGEYDEELVRRALLRENERHGQAFFLHNRVETIEETAVRLRGLCPGMRFLVAHGQMEESLLEERMMAFLRGDADVLVCTSIIESGIDIPQANTLFVERADMFGLSQLYQIRGRVGRSRERAYAYLLYPSAAALTPEAAQRLSALSDYTELGAGFKIAMRDLELRGAGNLLGDEQSGHVAALGFELYMQMLDEAVAAMEEASDGAGADRGMGAGAPGRLRRRLRPGRLHPLRAGQGRRPPPDRRRPRGRRPGGAARRARGPLRRAARAADEPDLDPAGADQVRPGRRDRRHDPRRPALDDPDRDGLQPRQGVPRRDPRSAVRVGQVPAVGPDAQGPGGALPGDHPGGRRAAGGHARRR